MIKLDRKYCQNYIFLNYIIDRNGIIRDHEKSCRISNKRENYILKKLIGLGITMALHRT